MFCGNCGNKIEEGERFCSACGNSVEVEKLSENSSANLASIKMPSFKCIMAIVAVMVIILGGFVVIKNKKYKIDVNDYMVITFQGCDGYASAVVDFDEEALGLEMIKHSKIKGLDTKILKNAESIEEINAYQWVSNMQGSSRSETTDAWEEYIFDLENANFDYEVDKREQLKNGDEVTVSYSFNSELIEKYGIKLIAKDKKFKVEGLQEAQVYDALKDYQVVFEGIAPYVTVCVNEEDNDFRNYMSYELSEYSGLRVGDKVTLTLDVDQEALARDKGYYVEETTKEYVCEGVGSYVTKLEEIPGDMIEKMRQQGEDCISAYVANWDEPDTFENQTIVGNYLLTAKDNGVTYEKYNYLYFVYKVNVKTEEGNFSFYYYVCYNNVMLLPDGTCSVDLADYEQPKGGWFSDETFVEGGKTYCGYKKLESLKNQCVTTMIESYEYETNIAE